VNNEKRYRDRDARVGYVERGPGIGVSNVQIEQKKIDHVSVEKPISEISQNPGEQQRKREIAKPIGRSRSDEHGHHDRQRDDGNYNEKSIVPPERSERCAGIRNVNQAEEIRYDDMRVIWTNETQDQVLRQLIQCVERQ